jgi:hypothetical protein
MMSAQELCRGVLDGTINAGDLSGVETDLVIEYLTECAEGFVGTEHDDMASELLDLLDFLRGVKADQPFESAIQEAEIRGSTYWEIENPSVH